MKKALLFLFVSTFSIVFIACSSDSDDNVGSLDGTTWESFGNEEGFIYQSTIKFYESTYRISRYEEFDDERNESSSSGTYIYRHPDVTLIEDGSEYTLTLRISGNKLGVGNDIVYTRR